VVLLGADLDVQGWEPLLDPGGEGGLAGSRIDPGASPPVGLQVVGVVAGGCGVGEVADGGVGAGGLAVANAPGVGSGLFDPCHDVLRCGRGSVGLVMRLIWGLRKSIKKAGRHNGALQFPRPDMRGLTQADLGRVPAPRAGRAEELA
jgi:hypothetical protein